MTTPTDPASQSRYRFLTTRHPSAQLLLGKCRMEKQQPSGDELRAAILRDAEAYTKRHGGDPDWLANEWMKEQEGTL